MTDLPLKTFRNHLQRAKHNVNLALQVKGLDIPKDSPLEKLIGIALKVLNRLVSVADGILKEYEER